MINISATFISEGTVINVILQGVFTVRKVLLDSEMTLPVSDIYQMPYLVTIPMTISQNSNQSPLP